MTKVEETRNDRKHVDLRDAYYRPTHVGLDNAAKWVVEKRNVPMNAHYLKRACESGRLAYSIISGKRCFSESDLDDLLVSLRREVSA